MLGQLLCLASGLSGAPEDTLRGTNLYRDRQDTLVVGGFAGLTLTSYPFFCVWEFTLITKRLLSHPIGRDGLRLFVVCSAGRWLGETGRGIVLSLGALLSALLRLAAHVAGMRDRF